jgi:RNA-binding protein NOB1
MGGVNQQEENSDDDNDDDDDGWETARKSKNARRKHKRKMIRRQERQLETQEDDEGVQQQQMLHGGGGGVSSQDNNSPKPTDGTAAGASASSTQGAPQVDSPVVSLTGDFAMQNVLLQMGLKVAGPKDGMLIREARKFGLRCHACGYSTDRPEKLSNDIFCPKCGNMNTLDRCQVVVSSMDGRVSYLQIKKKQQSLRGTQYSLPAPQTGRNARNPILREDSLKLPKHKAKPNMDAFAPEYNDETWHTHTKNNTKADLAKTIYLEEVKQLSKKNPNTRKLTRTNRRR